MSVRGSFFFVLTALSFFVVHDSPAAAYTGQTPAVWCDHDGSYDGAFDDTNHWSGIEGYPSNYTFTAKFNADAASGSYAVAFPAGTFSNAAPYQVTVANGRSVSLTGAGTDWIMPGGDSDIYPVRPAVFYNNNYPFVEVYLPSGSFSAAPQRLTDFNVTASAGADGRSATLVFSGGSNNFYDVSGTAPSTLPYFVINPKDNQNYRECEVVFRDGASSRLPNVDIKSNSATNRLTFCGGDHLIGGALTLPGISFTGDYSATRPCVVIVAVTNGANVDIAGQTSIGSLPLQVLKRYIFEVDGSSLSFGGSIQQSGSYGFNEAAFFVRDGVLDIDVSNNYFARLANQRFEMLLTNSVFRLTGSLTTGPTSSSSSSGTSRFLAVDSFVDWTVKSVKQFSGDTELVFRNSVLSNLCDITIGYQPIPDTVARVVLDGDGGSSYFKEDFKMSNTATESAFTVSGGVHRIDSAVFKIGCADGSKATFTVAGGSLTLGANNANCAFAFGAGSTATLNLFGGTLAAQAIKGGAGESRLVADGGTFRLTAGGTAISGFSTATVNAGGLTIDTDGKEFKLSQNFTGTGTITIIGGGKVTIADGCTVSCGLDIRDGSSVVFAGSASLGTLALGRDGSTCPLSIPCGADVSVGDLDVNEFNVTFTGGTYVKSDDVYTIFAVTGNVFGETAENWCDAKISSGVATECAAEKSLGSDGKSLVLKLRDSVTVTVAVPAGETATTNLTIFSAAGDTFVFDVGEGGSFTASAPLRGSPALVKRGGGVLVLESADNVFGSVTNEAGTIVLRHPDALGGAVVPISGDGIVYDFAESAETESTFTVAKAQSNEVVHVDIAGADVTMPLFDIVNGGIVKDGRGAVSFMMPDNNVRLTTTPAQPWKGNKNGDAGFTIRQGEVAFRGRTATRRELGYAYMGLKIGVSEDIGDDSPVPPSIVFDNIIFEAPASQVVFARDGADPTAGTPSFVVSNKAAVTINGVVTGDNSGSSAGAVSKIFVDDGSLLKFGYQMILYPDGGDLDFVADHCSTVMMAAVSLRGDIDMVFRNGSCLRSTTSTALDLNYGFAKHETSFRFESGSVMCVNNVGEDSADRVSYDSICDLVFNGGEWRPSETEYTFGFERITGTLSVEGEGLVLSPSEGQVWTMGVPVVDSADVSGGLVKRGEGTLVLDAANKAYTGVTRVEGGTLDMNGTTWSKAKIGGGDGEFSNGVLASPRIVLDVADDGESWTADPVPVLDASMLTGRVRVDLGRTSSDPLSLPRRSLVVARYTGDAPAVANWRICGTGIDGTGATFMVDEENKTVVACVEASSAGLMLLVR